MPYKLWLVNDARVSYMYSTFISFERAPCIYFGCYTPRLRRVIHFFIGAISTNMNCNCFIIRLFMKKCKAVRSFVR